MPDDNLKEQCLKLRAAAGEGEKWLADNSAHISNAENLRKRLRRAGRRLKSYAEAAGHKMGLAVFGPSQSGKSTLISNLGRGPDGSLNVRFGGEVLDFLTQVNPTGGNETTGLVTRFSLEPTPASPDAAHPVCLKLFSETDIVKILANTYFAEAKGALLISEEEMLAGLKALAARPAADSRLTLDDMEDLAEYVKNISETSAYGDLLERVYWGRAVDLGSRLDFDGRAALFSYLWGKVDEFTAIYKRLYKTLELLRFNETVFCELSALNEGGNEKEGGLGRKNSILHVDRLLGLLDDQAGETVSVVSRDGAKAALTRPVLSALTAEVHVQILEKTGDFMDKADLLDFPGYRSREKLTDIAEEIKKPETLKKCFLRGKVAYLFERCSARKEISAMLLCIGDSVQNNPDLPGMIDQWLREAHGQNAAERAGKKPSLFLVLTKFDATFEQGAGGADAMTRWETRYKASFLQFFGSYSWPAEWGMEDGRPAPFKNLFWLLNLHFGKSILEVETLDGDRDWYKAKRVLPARAVETQQLYEGYMEAPGTKKHFAEPRAAWEAVLGAEDGGVAYIANKLNPVLSVDLKSRQLTALAAAEAGVIEGALRDFYQGGDKDEE
ncbi:MAG: putative virulence factor, partial [Candidatus Adiutrix sp.]|nr:putative virulence factor [Candidatus Adiutrix sp.]